jgi:hypothetical protein
LVELRAGISCNPKIVGIARYNIVTERAVSGPIQTHTITATGDRVSAYSAVMTIIINKDTVIVIRDHIPAYGIVIVIIIQDYTVLAPGECVIAYCVTVTRIIQADAVVVVARECVIDRSRNKNLSY